MKAVLGRGLPLFDTRDSVMPRSTFHEVIERLDVADNELYPSAIADPWLLVLSENVAYLADDERRERAMRAFEAEVGTDPERILAATPDQLEAITRHVRGDGPGAIRAN
jgi:hypothetical protein